MPDTQEILFRPIPLWKQYCNVILRVSWMGLFGWDGDKPFQCLRIGRQFHLQALQKYTVSCWRALDTSIYNLTACYGLFFLSAQWKRVHPPSRPKVMHKPSFRRHYKSIVSSNRFQLLARLCGCYTLCHCWKQSIILVHQSSPKINRRSRLRLADSSIPFAGLQSSPWGHLVQVLHMQLEE